jgi:2-polyprenyl-3-methyl-5-hydroxy-6-metoxy-1,4-benzoquinol methylase
MTRKERWEHRYFKIQRRIVPGLKYSQTIFEETLSDCVKEGVTWLDAGCGHQILPEWRLAEEQALVRKSKMVVGVDLDFEGMKKHRTVDHVSYANLQSLPFAAESFDLVTCNMVVEHLTDPEAVFKEFYRILRPGGRVIIHTPNAFGYTTVAARMLPQFARVRLAGILEGRPAEDVFPAFYRANTPAALDAMLSKAGFRREKLRCIATACALYFSRFLVVFELAYVRLTLLPALSRLRTNLLCVYTK